MTYGAKFRAALVAADISVVLWGDGTIGGRELLTPEQEATLQSILDTYVPEEDSDETVVPVTEVTAAQAKVALIRNGYMTQVRAAVVNYPEDIQEWFNSASVWYRNHPYLTGIGLEIGLTEEQMDGLFLYASQLDR